jgi:hypothetical protein
MKSIMIYSGATLVIPLLLFGCSDPTSTTVAQLSTQIKLVPWDSVEEWSTGPYDVDSFRISVDLLHLWIHSSPSINSSFTLVTHTGFAETSPVQSDALLSFTPGGDPSVTRSFLLLFDLTPLRRSWQRAYRRQSGEIWINLRFGAPNRVTIPYTF